MFLWQLTKSPRREVQSTFEKEPQQVMIPDITIPALADLIEELKRSYTANDVMQAPLSAFPEGWQVRQEKVPLVIQPFLQKDNLSGP